MWTCSIRTAKRVDYLKGFADMGIANPIDASYNSIVHFEVFGIDCQFTANIAVVSNLKCGHPVLAVVKDFAHFARLNLR